MNIPVYSFVAYSGTGKTTLLEKLIPELKSLGLRVAVIKHDAHNFEVDYPGKDSWRMSHAGADISAIVSESHAAIMINYSIDPDYIFSMIHDVDLILTEGYKFGSWKKIGIFRKKSGKLLPKLQDEYYAVMTDEIHIPVGKCKNVLGLDEIKKLAILIKNDLYNEIP